MLRDKVSIKTYFLEDVSLLQITNLCFCQKNKFLFWKEAEDLRDGAPGLPGDSRNLF